MEIIKITNKKINVILYGLFFSFFVIIFKLFYLQIYLNKKLFILSEKNFTRIQKTVCPRGNIVDINNNILVTNRPVINIYWQGTGNRNLSKEQNEVLKTIEDIIEKNLFNTEDLIRIKNAERFSKNTVISNDLSFEKLVKIVEKFSNSKNVQITTKFIRFYPYQSLASHIIGYLSQIDTETIGKMGLEKLFENELKGEYGQKFETINSLGKSLIISEIKPAIPGKTIKTTIDLELQKICEQIFPENYKGALIVFDPENGSIKATLSRPNFDPSKFLKQLTLAEWNEFQEKQPFLNRAFYACYPPASIFKLITISAAIELGIIKQDSFWFCKGYINFAKRRYHCAAHAQGHGLITPNEAIVKSCNTFFYNIAKQIYIDELANYARYFGLGEKTGIIFAEKSGLVPTNSWKKKVFNESWWPGETLSAVIGQSYLLVTPLQVARMISSIFQGYIVTPRILVDEKIRKKTLNIKKETLDFLKEAMKSVTEYGTGQRIGKIKDILIYAKTGTAQTSMLSKRNLGTNFLEHAWFASHFSYKDQKPLTLVILIEHAGSATLAINTARKFLILYKRLFKNI